MSVPSPEFQLQFLAYIQRLMDEGEFVATYKYALMVALADISIEHGRDDESELEIATPLIAEKFVRYYWRQTKPFLSESGADILLQNTGQQARVVNLVSDLRGTYTTLPPSDDAAYRRLVAEVAATVRVMPLWKLQMVGREVVDFLYPNASSGKSITLRPGVAFCFRRFHGLVRRLAQDGWIRFVRERRRNQELLGGNIDLGVFLFGSERESLDAYRPLLREIQSGCCFYCGRSLRDSEVDHFIPWSRYPHDLGHNFVLACRTCNNDKRDLLAADRHVEHWCRRNVDHGRTMTDYFEQEKLAHDRIGSVTISRWAYGQAVSAGAQGWVRPKIVEPLTHRTLRLLEAC